MTLDQSAIAIGHLLRQFGGKPRIEALMRSIFDPMTPLATALVSLQTALDIDAATDDRLDKIGSIVGISRDIPEGIYLPFFGFASQPSGRGFGRARMRHDGEEIASTYTAPNAEYRAMIRAKIALNNGHGTAPEIAAALQSVFGAKVSVRDYSTGRALAWIGRIPLPDEAIGRIAERLIPRTAGVAIGVVYYRPGATFGFKGQRDAVGFGKGPMARTPPSNIYPI